MAKPKSSTSARAEPDFSELLTHWKFPAEPEAAAGMNPEMRRAVANYYRRNGVANACAERLLRAYWQVGNDAESVDEALDSVRPWLDAKSLTLFANQIYRCAQLEAMARKVDDDRKNGSQGGKRAAENRRRKASEVKRK